MNAYGLEYPATLPKFQMPSESFADGDAFAEIDVLHGPSRRRRLRRVARPQWSFEVWFTPAQAQEFDAWYTRCVTETYGGAFVLPWWSRSRVVAFAEPYTLRALGNGWRLAGTVALIGHDNASCEAHINAVFGRILRDPWDTTDLFNANYLAAADVWSDDFDLALIAREAC